MTSLPLRSGIGLKGQHYEALLSAENTISWLELHPENYMGQGGAPHYYLKKLRERYPLSMHGVGMSLGSIDGINAQHLEKLADLVDRYNPSQVSEHLSWSHWNQTFLNDLLPLPYTDESLAVITRNIHRVQDRLKRKILIENPSVYVAFTNNEYSETAFLAEVCKATGCGLLLDINNVCVSGQNTNFDPWEYLLAIPGNFVQEIHLAGHTQKKLTNDQTVCIDDHGSHVSQKVWQLYEHFLDHVARPVATLIEWDTDVPEFSTLRDEAKKADHILAKKRSSNIAETLQCKA